MTRRCSSAACATTNYDQPSAGSATIASRAFSTLDEAEEVERTYRSGAWTELLDAGCEHDANLYRAWVPERIRRDFHGASLRGKDLALYTPGRQLRGWENEALEQMAPTWSHSVSRSSTSGQRWSSSRTTGATPPSAGCGVRRYGWRNTGVVRIDSTGEVFIRLDPDAVAGHLLRPVPDEEW